MKAKTLKIIMVFLNFKISRKKFFITVYFESLITYLIMGCAN